MPQNQQPRLCVPNSAVKIAFSPRSWSNQNFWIFWAVETIDHFILLTLCYMHANVTSITKHVSGQVRIYIRNPCNSVATGFETKVTTFITIYDIYNGLPLQHTPVADNPIKLCLSFGLLDPGSKVLSSFWVESADRFLRVPHLLTSYHKPQKSMYAPGAIFWEANIVTGHKTPSRIQQFQPIDTLIFEIRLLFATTTRTGGHY